MGEMEMSENLDDLTPNQRRALDKGLAALEAMAAMWGAEIRLNDVSKVLAAKPEASRAGAIAAFIEQAFIEGAYRHYLDRDPAANPALESRASNAGGAVAWAVPAANGGVQFGPGWMFSAVKQGAASMPLYTHPAPASKEPVALGWALVPVEPTDDMLRAPDIGKPVPASVSKQIERWDRRRKEYAAMLSHVPPAPGTDPDDIKAESKEPVADERAAFGVFPNCGSCREWCGCNAWPALVQKRMRPTWEPEGRGWTQWEDCTEESARDCERTPINGGWQYEVRRLYTDAAQQSKEDSDPAMHEAKYLEGYRAALATAQTPEGRRLVPVEPTPEMIKAGAKSGGLGMDFHEWMGRIAIAWREMLAAAPAKEV